MMYEYRFSELRAEGRTLLGTAMPYNVVSPGHRELFRPGAFAGQISDVALDVQHDRKRIIARTGGGGLELHDTQAALLMRAVLPDTREAHDTLTLVRGRVLRGLSVEFQSLQESRQGSLRVIERAALPRLSVVDSGSYPGTDLQVRARRPRKPRKPGRRRSFARGMITTDPNRALDCDCLDRNAGVYKVSFEEQAFDQVVEQVEADEINIVAHTGSFRPENVLGDTRSGTLVLESLIGALFVALMPAAAGTAAGKALAESKDAAPPVIRPLIDQEMSEYEDDPDEGIRLYRSAWIRSILFKWADKPGWEPVEFGDESREQRRRRVWL